jgi:beta-lactamase regulating signal transducer with metallopeptidase domain
MIPLIETIDGWSEAWLGLAWAILWQSVLVVAVAALIAGTLLRRSPPALRYWLWQIVALKLLVMPFWTMALPLPEFLAAREPRPAAAVPVDGPGAPQGETSPVQSVTLPLSMPATAAETEPAPAPSWFATITWPSWLLVAWLAVVAWQVLRIAYQRVQLARLLRRAVPATDERLHALLTEAAGQLGLRPVPRPVLTDCECSPFVFGLWRAVLVLPETLLPTLGPAQLRQVLLHELAHVKRRDLLWGWLPEIARLVYWFHPLVHWMYYRLRLERELACDQVAMTYSGQGSAGYADTLIQVVSHTAAGTLLRTAALSSAGLDGGTSHAHNAKEATT